MVPSRRLEIDFTAGPIGYRLRRAGGGHALLRAVQLSRHAGLRIVDATAGLGRDAFLLAAAGAEVTLIERSAPVHALLRAALLRAERAGAGFRATAARMSLVRGDARELLPALAPDIVLVDPMHPERRKSALVKQEMRLLRELVGSDPDAPELMAVALAAARRRVVLKWPRRLPPMPGLPEPSHRLLGKTVRYEVFLTGPR